MIGPVLAIVAAWLALSALFALFYEANTRENLSEFWFSFFAFLLMWALIFVVVGGLGYGVHALWGAL